MRPLNQDIETLNPEPPLDAPDVENAADESGILTDQDQTLAATPNEGDALTGGDAVVDYGAEDADFARGEVDVKEQMDRTTRTMDAGLHRPPDPNANTWPRRPGMTDNRH